MNRSLVSAIAYAATVTAATLAASAFTTVARAESPTIDNTPFVSTRTRAEVRAEVLGHRSQLSAAGTEWALQLPQFQQPGPATAVTRRQLQAEYIAARDQVRAMHGEDSGSAFIAQGRSRDTGTLLAGGSR